MENTAKFNSAYAFIVSEITSILQNAQTPVASDNPNLNLEVCKAMDLCGFLLRACELKDGGAFMLKLQEKIINSKKQNNND